MLGRELIEQPSYILIYNSLQWYSLLIKPYDKAIILDQIYFKNKKWI